MSTRAATVTVPSSDGQAIYFVSVEGDVWAVSLVDGTERQLTDLLGRRGNLSHAALATDGDYVYFGWGQDHGDIWVMDVVQDEDDGSDD